MLWINILILLSCLKIRKHLSLVLEDTGRMFPTHIDQLQNLIQGQLWTTRFPPYSYVINQFSVWCCLEMRPLGETLRVRSVCSPSLFLPLFFPPLSVCLHSFLFPSFLPLCHAMWVYNMMTPAYKCKSQPSSENYSVNPLVLDFLLFRANIYWFIHLIHTSLL